MFKPYRYEKKNKSYIKRNGLLRTLSPLAFFAFGLGILALKVIFPVVFSYADSHNREPVISPFNSAVISTTTVDNKVNGEDFSFNELTEKAKSHDTSQDADLLSQKSSSPKPENFYISIPKLEIYDAIVEVDSKNMDPKEALGHFNGSCLPGDGCNTFIYGHSTFKYIKNKYKEGDYSGVFSKLDELQYGDEFSIRYMGNIYKYIVDFTRVQDPKEVDPLGSPYPKSIGKHESTVELFTCTPSGTTKYRLSVVGKLVL